MYNYLSGNYLGWGWPDKKKLDEEEAKIFLGAMAIGIMDMHKAGVAHYDTHCANYSYDEDGYPILIDFGCA